MTKAPKRLKRMTQVRSWRKVTLLSGMHLPSNTMCACRPQPLSQKNDVDSMSHSWAALAHFIQESHRIRKLHMFSGLQGHLKFTAVFIFRLNSRRTL